MEIFVLIKTALSKEATVICNSSILKYTFVHNLGETDQL